MICKNNTSLSNIKCDKPTINYNNFPNKDLEKFMKITLKNIDNIQDLSIKYRKNIINNTKKGLNKSLKVVNKKINKKSKKKKKKEKELTEKKEQKEVKEKIEEENLSEKIGEIDSTLNISKRRKLKKRKLKKRKLKRRKTIKKKKFNNNK